MHQDTSMSTGLQGCECEHEGNEHNKQTRAPKALTQLRAPRTQKQETRAKPRTKDHTNLLNQFSVDKQIRLGDLAGLLNPLS